MKILYFTEDISSYGGAYYQRDVLNNLKKHHDVDTYGPRFDNYSKSDSIDDVLSKYDSNPDLICIGHKWLRDDPTKEVDPHPKLNFADTEIPTTMILNKEYVNFDEKIKFAENNNISLVFTHHHKADEWSNRYDPEFVFWPFAVNDDRFRDFGEDKVYDMSFSGILRNPHPWVPQTDLRIRVQQELFYSVGELKLALRPKYRKYNIFWRAKPTNNLYKRLNKLIHRERRLPDEDYKKIYNRSKLAFNTLSPIGLVGTRYYEAMASNSLVFCQGSNIYEEYDLFVPGEHCVTFNDDLSDFDRKLEYYLTND